MEAGGKMIVLPQDANKNTPFFSIILKFTILPVFPCATAVLFSCGLVRPASRARAFIQAAVTQTPPCAAQPT
jgi:hypothetical protein